MKRPGSGLSRGCVTAAKNAGRSRGQQWRTWTNGAPTMGYLYDDQITTWMGDLLIHVTSRSTRKMSGAVGPHTRVYWRGVRRGLTGERL